MDESTEIFEAAIEDAAAMAAVHFVTRRFSMPYVTEIYSEADMRGWIARAIADRPAGAWVVRREGAITAYMLVDRDTLEHLYVCPQWQCRGIGSALLKKAKDLSPDRLSLRTYQRAADAQEFYKAQGFRAVEFTEGQNEEGEPDVQYVWEGGR